MDRIIEEIYDEIRNYCRENQLRLSTFNIQGNYFKSLEIVIYEDTEYGIQCYSFKSQDYEWKRVLPERGDKHTEVLNKIMACYIY